MLTSGVNFTRTGRVSRAKTPNKRKLSLRSGI